MALASNALIKVEEYKQYADVPTDNKNVNDQNLELHINSASQLIEEYCDRKFITPDSAIQEIFDGDGTKDYYVRNRRITETPTIYYWDGDSWAELGSTFDWTYDSDTGRVYFTDGNVFSKIKDYYRIDYKYGWAIANVPATLKLACVELVKRAIKRLEKAGLKSESFGDATTSYDFKVMPDHIKAGLDKYRRVSFG